MNIQGIVKSSLIDYAGYASTVLFCGGCPFRCGYCHNPELALAPVGGESRYPVEEVLAFLTGRRRFIDAVCLTGGEPTMQADLADFLAELRQLKLRVKLDTNGYAPEVLEKLVTAGLLDYVALDIKGPLDRYAAIVGRSVRAENIRGSAEIIRAIDHEYRTTVCREQLDEADLRRMKEEFPEPRRWFLQRFQDSGKLIGSAGAFSAYSIAEMDRLGEALCVSVR